MRRILDQSHQCDSANGSVVTGWSSAPRAVTSSNVRIGAASEPLPSDSARSPVLSLPEVNRAIEALSPEDHARLEWLSRNHAWGCPTEPADLLQNALVKLLGGERRCRVGVSIVREADEAMRSLADNERKKWRRTPVESLGFEPAGASGPEEWEARWREQDALALFDDDPVGRRVLELILDGWKGADLRRRFAEEPGSVRSHSQLSAGELATIRHRIGRRLKDARKQGLV